MRSAAQLFFKANLLTPDCPVTTIHLAGNTFCMKSGPVGERELIASMLKIMDLLEMRYQDRWRWLTSLSSERLYEAGVVNKAETLELVYEQLSTHVSSIREKRKGACTESFLERVQLGLKKTGKSAPKGVCLPLDQIPGDCLNECSLSDVVLYRMDFGESLIMLDYFDDSMNMERIEGFWSMVEEVIGKKAFVIENTTQIPCLKGFGFLAEDAQCVVSRLNKY